MKEILDGSTNTLKIDKKIKKILIDNNIDTILKVCEKSRLDLNAINLTNNQINEIIVALQLLGLDLKKNHTKKNKCLEKFIKK